MIKIILCINLLFSRWTTLSTFPIMWFSNLAVTSKNKSNMVDIPVCIFILPEKEIVYATSSIFVAVILPCLCFRKDNVH